LSSVIQPDGAGAGAAPALLIRGLTKRYGDRLAVNNLNLTIPQGELFGFLGPNGAGKTTTIKMLVGLLRPTAGQAILCGYDVVEAPLQARRLTGYVPDHAALYEKLTGREMLGLIADLFAVPRDQQRQRMAPMLETFNLSSHGDELVQSYSRGMRQKLALCAALIHDPQVLFLDEPTVGLDPAGARQIKAVLKHLCSEGRTVFLSTHVLEIAELLCDRVGIVQKGELIALGKPSELRSEGGHSTLESAFLNLTGDAADDELGPLIKALKG
jgi:ABC-2 type transport system ATP-binding protein